MKKISNYFLMLFAVASMAALSSCGGEDDPVTPTPNRPIVKITANGQTDNDITIRTNESVTFVLNATQGDRNLKNFKLVTTGGNQVPPTAGLQTKKGKDILSASGYDINNVTDPNRNGYIDTLFVPGSYFPNNNATTNFIFTATDRDDQTTEVIVTVRTSNALSLGPDTTYSAVLLSAPLAGGNSATFFNTSGGVVLSQNEIQSNAGVAALADFGYYYGSANQASLASINDYPPAILNIQAAVENKTMFKKVTGVTLSGTTGVGLATTYTGSTVTAAERVTNLAQGDILSFKTDAAVPKYGLIQIGSIVGTNGSNGRINLTVKVQR